MERLSGVDAWHVYDETPREPQHTLKLLVLGPSAERPWSFSCARAALAARLHRLPLLRSRLVRVPLDLHHPVWVEDPDLDLDHHVRRLAIPAPGTRRELCEVISDITSLPLSLDRPLWECWFLEGFEGDRVVLVLKMSHGLGDGGKVRQMLLEALDPEPTDAPEQVGRRAVPPLPSPGLLLRQAVRDRVRDAVVRVPRLLGATLAARRRRRKAPLPEGPSHFDAPPDGFGGPLGLRRSLAWATVGLEEARQVRATLDATVTDVIVATLAGGVRRYLWEREELPDGPILGMLVASIHAEHDRRVFGNRKTQRTLWLPTHLPDPVARVREASRETHRVKQDVALHDGAQFEDWVEVFTPAMVKLMTRAFRRGAQVSGLSGGVMISSVVGPETPLYAGPIPVEEFVSFGYLKYAAGLNVVVWSYAGALNLALCADRDRVPDAWRLAEHVEAAFAELVGAALPAGGDLGDDVGRSEATRPSLEDA